MSYIERRRSRVVEVVEPLLRSGEHIEVLIPQAMYSYVPSIISRELAIVLTNLRVMIFKFRLLPSKPRLSREYERADVALSRYRRGLITPTIALDVGKRTITFWASRAFAHDMERLAAAFTSQVSPKSDELRNLFNVTSEET